MDWKRISSGEHMRGKRLGMVFFNPSLRTRTSFEAAMIMGGGHAIVLEVGGGVWKLEDREGAVMDGDKTEHLKEAVPVLSRYLDMIAVRTFAKGENEEEDNADPVIRGFRKYATVPVISMESAREHPCQGFADMLTLREKFGPLKGKRVTLTWAPHIKPLPKAVPNSFLLTAAACGCDVQLAHPPGFDLHPSVLEEAKAYAAEAGGSVSVGHDQGYALENSIVLYAKAWGPSLAPPLFSTPVENEGGVVEDPAEGKSKTGREGDNPQSKIQNPISWMPTLKHFESMHPDAIFMHCLPVRRNVEVSDEVLDSPRSAVVDEAENRLHVQRVLLDMLAQGGNS